MAASKPGAQRIGPRARAIGSSIGRRAFDTVWVSALRRSISTDAQLVIDTTTHSAKIVEWRGRLEMEWIVIGVEYTERETSFGEALK